MTGFLWAALGVLSGFGLAAVGDMVSEEVRDRLEQLPHTILRLAARQLDEAERGILYEEVWLPDLAYFLKGDEARPVTRLIEGTRYALGILLSARKSARYLRQARASTSRDETPRSTEATSNTKPHEAATRLLGRVGDNVLGDLARKLTAVRGYAGGHWAVPLLREVLVIAPDASAELLGLVDDNVLSDLARELTAAGEYAQARIAGAAMRLFFETKTDILADLALAQAEAALKEEAAGWPETAAKLPTEPTDLRAAETANLAAVPARQLAKAAAALTLSGEHALAAQRWADAMAAAQQEPDPYQALANLAQAQVRAGLLDDATQVIAGLLNDSPTGAHDWQANAVLDPAWQAATTLVAALAGRGDVTRASTVLEMIPDFAASYPRAVRALACAIAATDVTEAERLAGQVRDPDGRGLALAAVAAAALAAGHQRDAIRMAREIEHPCWQAQALIDLAAAPGQADGIPAAEVRDAITAVTDAEACVVLLTDYAVTRDARERRWLLAEATRLAGKLPADDRWRVLANIGAIETESGLAAEAREAFTAAQLLLAKDARERGFELYQLYHVRLAAGDTDGARETAAVAFGACACDS